MKINLRKLNSYLLLFVTILFLLSGYGMTQSRIVKPLTFGILDKPASFRLHSFLAVIFIVLLAIHIVPIFKKRKK